MKTDVALQEAGLLQGEPSLGDCWMQLLWLEKPNCHALGRLHAKTPGHGG